MADATRIKGEAEATYNARVSSSLTPTLIQQQYLSKWDGRLPQYSFGGNAVPLVQIRACPTGAGAEGALMLERLGRLCVGVGSLWVLMVVGTGLMVGLDKPETAGAVPGPSDRLDLRQLLYLALTFVVVPIGMLMIIRDMIGDPEPLWLKLAAPGGFAAVYALFLAAAVPQLGQPLLLAADPVVAQMLPSDSLTRIQGTASSWLTRFGALLAIIAAIPGALGLVAGLLHPGGSRRPLRKRSRGRAGPTSSTSTSTRSTASSTARRA